MDLGDDCVSARDRTSASAPGGAESFKQAWHLEFYLHHLKDKLCVDDSVVLGRVSNGILFAPLCLSAGCTQ